MKETLLLSKVREIITENILLFRYQKQATTAAALKGDDALMLVPVPSAAFYCQPRHFTNW